MKEKGSHEHHRAEGPTSIACQVLTVSDSRTLKTDKSGPAMIRHLEAAGHRVIGRAIVPDDASAIQAAVLGALENSETDAVLVTGGTGISPRDLTADVLAELCERTLPGYGELFRMLSWQEIGSAAMLSRALAGSRDGRLLVATPGSPAAVDLAMEKLLLPELGHLLREIRKEE